MHVPGDRSEIRILEPSAMPMAVMAVACGGVDHAVAKLLLGERQQQVAPLDAIPILDEPLPARDPGARLADLPSKLEAEREPEDQRAARRSSPLRHEMRWRRSSSR